MFKNIGMLILCMAIGLAVFFLAPLAVPIGIGLVIFMCAKAYEEDKNNNKPS